MRVLVAIADGVPDRFGRALAPGSIKPAKYLPVVRNFSPLEPPIGRASIEIDDDERVYATIELFDDHLDVRGLFATIGYRHAADQQHEVITVAICDAQNSDVRIPAISGGFMTKPITPAEAQAQAGSAPPAVFEAFNRLIAKNMRAGSDEVVVLQDEVVKLLMAMGYSRTAIFNEHWLDVEPAYERAGWKVMYDKPGWNETGQARFVFVIA